MPLYEYAVIRVDESGHDSLVVPIRAVMARDEEHVRKIAIREIPPPEKDIPAHKDFLLEEAKILVRPFCPL